MFDIILRILGIFLAILLIITIVLIFGRSCVILEFNNELILQIKVLFFKFNIFPKKKADNKEKDTKEKKGKASKDIPVKKDDKKPVGKNPFFQTEELSFGDYTAMLYVIADKFIKKVTCEYLEIDIIVASDNAADTAVNYGRIHAVLHPIIGAFYNTGRLKKASVKIRPNFTINQPVYRAKAIFYTRIIYIIKCIYSIYKNVLSK